MKRARALFTEGYNCQKNKRLQSLFAHIFLHQLPAPSKAELSVPCLLISPPLQSYPLAPATFPIRSVLRFYLLFGYLLCMPHLPPHHRAVIVVSSISRRSFLAFLSLSRSRRLPAIVVTPWKTHSSRGSTNSQLRSFTSTWLAILTLTLESWPRLRPRRVRTIASAAASLSCDASFLGIFLVNLLWKPIMRGV